MKKYLVLYQAEGAPGGMSVSEMLRAPRPSSCIASGDGRLASLAREGWWRSGGFWAPLDKSTKVLGGSATAGRTSITGYTILQAESMDRAVLLMKDHPHFRMPGASAQILECVAIPGM
jgi:hypothetical protein